MLLVLTVQCLSGALLWLILALLPLLGFAVLQHGWRLLRRMRWLVISLVAILGWGVAGDPLWEGSVPAPTAEGLLEALTQSARLALMLAAVAWLVERTPVATLMTGCHALLRPLRALGLDVERAVARLMLTLHYAETLPPVSDWRALIAPGAPLDQPETAVIHLEKCHIGTRDVVAIAAAASILAGVLAA